MKREILEESNEIVKEIEVWEDWESFFHLNNNVAFINFYPFAENPDPIVCSNQKIIEVLMDAGDKYVKKELHELENQLEEL